MHRWANSAFCRKFGIKLPIVGAPMGGGPSTPELAAAICENGGIGSLGAAYLSPPDIEAAIKKLRGLTSRPFIVNLFCPHPPVEITAAQFEAARDHLHSVRASLQIPDPEQLRPPFHPNFDAQFETVVSNKPAAFSFVFGQLEPHYIQRCKDAGIYTIGTATSLDEALQLASSGVDALVAQGVEAGGHRGMFSASDRDPCIGTVSLTALIAEHVHIPVLAAGGIMSGRDIAQVLEAGAQSAALGTAFLLCPEAGTSLVHRQSLHALQGGSDVTDPTALTRSFSGRLARGIRTPFYSYYDDHPEALLPFPAHNAFTRDIRNQATRLMQPEYVSMWAGSGVRRIQSLPAREIMTRLEEELIAESS